MMAAMAAMKPGAIVPAGKGSAKDGSLRPVCAFVKTFRFWAVHLLMHVP